MRRTAVLTAAGLLWTGAVASAAPATPWTRLAAPGRGELKTAQAERRVQVPDRVRVRFGNGSQDRLEVDRSAGGPLLKASLAGTPVRVRFEDVDVHKSDVFRERSLIRNASHRLYRDRDLVAALEAGALDEVAARRAIRRTLPPQLRLKARDAFAGENLFAVLNGVARRVGGMGRSAAQAERGGPGRRRMQVIRLGAVGHRLKLVAVDLDHPFARHPDEAP
jgi:hypothetical protein